jgi:hypothetical protein
MALDVDKITSEVKVLQYDFDPDATTATDIGWVDMRDYFKILVSFFRTVGTSDLTLTILANTASDGSGDEATIVSKTFTAGQPNATGDYVFLEALASQVAQQGSEDSKDYRYVSANCTVDTGTDEGVVSYILDPRYCRDGLTADLIST